MTLHTKLEMDDDLATVTLVGYAGPETAARLDKLINGVAMLPVRRLVLDLERLTALPSASLRSLLMVHQRLGRDLEIELRGAQREVAETVRLSGFAASMVPVRARAA